MQRQQKITLGKMRQSGLADCRSFAATTNALTRSSSMALNPYKGLAGFEMRKSLFEIVRAVKGDAENDRVCFLGTLRAEFVGHVLEDRVLAETLVARDFFPLRAMVGDKQLMEVIRSPAERLGVELDQELAVRLLYEAAKETNPVRLLAFALHRIWQTLERGRIAANADSALGGALKDAMTLYANRIIDHMGTVEQEIARRLLCSLVSFEGLAAEFQFTPARTNKFSPPGRSSKTFTRSTSIASETSLVAS
jgi:hypothetical protein